MTLGKIAQTRLTIPPPWRPRLPLHTMGKERLDVVLLKRGLVETRAKAQALIMAGQVYVKDQKQTKAGTQIADDTAVDVRGQPHPWVSRGGLKLEKGIAVFAPPVQGITAIDVGASTGGFTDVLLANGADRVYAVDVGRGQLAWKLRSDERVIVLEKTNARHLTADLIPEPVDALVCDASFISLKKVLPVPLTLLKPGGWCLALIKPQFEVGKGEVGKGGVVRDPALHDRVCSDMADWFKEQDGLSVTGVTQSPIKGPEGNCEFLIMVQKNGD